MINLLSPNDQRQLAAARTNTLILRYIFLMSVVIAIMALEMLGVYLLLNRDMNNSQTTIESNNQKAAKYEWVEQKADAFRTNLAISKYILNKQAPYTQLILTIAKALPDNGSQKATIDSLSIEPSTFGTPITLTVQTDSSDTAIKVKTSLQETEYNNKKLFTAVSFESLSNPDASRKTYLATFQVTFSKDIVTQ
jgi:Tfp pilus assembly protein PilN